VGGGGPKNAGRAFSGDLWHLSGLDPTYAC